MKTILFSQNPNCLKQDQFIHVFQEIRRASRRSKTT